MGSDNPNGAENQQERLIQLGWVIGFVDGEGCFSIGFVRQGGGTGRCGYKTGYQVSHEFAVTQGAQSVSCLDDLVAVFGVGQGDRQSTIRQPPRAPVPLCGAESERADRNDHSVFRKHPMRTSKQGNFEKFAHCVELIDAGRHLSFEGLADIAEIVETMNRRKPRTDLIRILRGHTPNIQDTG